MTGLDSEQNQILPEIVLQLQILSRCRATGGSARSMTHVRAPFQSVACWQWLAVVGWLQKVGWEGCLHARPRVQPAKKKVRKTISDKDGRWESKVTVPSKPPSCESKLPSPLQAAGHATLLVHSAGHKLKCDGDMILDSKHPIGCHQGVYKWRDQESMVKSRQTVMPSVAII